MITIYDYLNIAFYLVFIIGVSVYFLRRNKNTSDYFRGGGILPWWMTGAMAWMASFSAWTFTGAAGQIYKTGPYVLILYYSSIIPLLALLFYTSFRFRRMRVITPFEAVRMRFGPGAQQFFTWIRLPLLLLFSGVGLNAVGVFMAAVFNVPLVPVLIAMGIMVTMISLLGGAFGVAASDFVQMFLVVSVALTTALLALQLPEIGGVAGLLDKVPAAHFDWTEIARAPFIALWFFALMINTLFGQNSIEASSKFLTAASDKQARLALIIPLLGTMLGPIIWIIPPMVAAVNHPDLAAPFPFLKHPEEAAFLATAVDVLPKGMLGLLVCGIFAATLTSMDAGLNQGAGIFVRNFYLPILNPQCSEKKLLIVSKLFTAVFGVIIILLAIFVSQYRTLGLFHLLNQLGIGLLLPLALPLFLGLFYKRTPSWSTWSCVVLGWALAYVIKFFIHPGMFTWVPGFEGPFKLEETTLFTEFFTVAAIVVVCGSWFFFTSLFYERSSAEYKANVEEFFARLREPLVTRKNEEARENQAIAGSVGKLCLIYGVFLSLLVFIPQDTIGARLCFLACGGLMVSVGLFLMWFYRTGKPPMLSGDGNSADPAG